MGAVYEIEGQPEYPVMGLPTTSWPDEARRLTVVGGQFSAFSRLERYSAKARRPVGVACTHVRGLASRNSFVMTR